MTAYGNRCGDCDYFPGSGCKCARDTEGRGKVFTLDYRCEAGATPIKGV